MKRISTFSTAFLIAFSHLLNADAPPLKIGFVNFEVAASAEQEAQKYMMDMEKEERTLLENEQRVRVELETKMAKFQQSMAALSDKARQEQQKSLGEEITKQQDQLGQKRVDLTQKRQRIVNDLENKNRLLLESIGRKENFSMIVNSAYVPYVAEDLKKNDVTSKLIAEYNKAYPVKAEPAKKEAPAKKGAPTPASPAPAKK